MNLNCLKKYKIDPEAVVNFVLKRRYKRGGFGSAPSVPPSMQDTYYALSILKVFSHITEEAFGYDPSKDELLRSYLKEFLEKEDKLDSRLIYYFIRTSNMVNFDFSLEELLRKIKNISSIEDLFYKSRIFQIENNDLPGDCWKNMKELRMYVYLKRDLGREEKDSIVSWIYSCKNPDGGFGFLPHTTSFMENTYYALDVLKKLETGLDEKDRDKIIHFIISCYTGKGGFTRKGIGAPFLDATYYAIRSFILLSSLSPSFYLS